MEFNKKRIFAHRGLWHSQENMNSLESLQLAANSGFSIETDVRTVKNNVAISHDQPYNEYVDANYLFSLDTTVALNIKSDGLLNYFIAHIEWLQNTNSFFFDGSIPELYKFSKLNLPIAQRLSEFEKQIPWQTGYIWLDSFESDWWLANETIKKLSFNNYVVVVSPEIHGRSNGPAWEVITNEINSGNINLAICTDQPKEFLQALGQSNEII